MYYAYVLLYTRFECQEISKGLPGSTRVYHGSARINQGLRDVNFVITGWMCNSAWSVEYLTIFSDCTARDVWSRYNLSTRSPAPQLYVHSCLACWHVHLYACIIPALDTVNNSAATQDCQLIAVTPDRWPVQGPSHPNPSRSAQSRSWWSVKIRHFTVFAQLS